MALAIILGKGTAREKEMAKEPGGCCAQAQRPWCKWPPQSTRRNRGGETEAVNGSPERASTSSPVGAHTGRGTQIPKHAAMSQLISATVPSVPPGIWYIPQIHYQVVLILHS